MEISIKSHCNSFLREVVNPGATQIHKIDAEMAFFAGAITMWQYLTEMLPRQSDEAAEEILKILNTEIEAFKAELLAVALRSGVIDAAEKADA